MLDTWRYPDLLHRASDFGALVQDVGYPAVRMGELRIDSRETWVDVLTRPWTAVERLTVLQSATLRRALLLVNDDARQRVRHWFAMATRLPTSPAARSAWLQTEVNLFGDEPFLDIIIRGLQTLPDCVVTSVVRECAFLAVGRVAIAWFAPGPFVHHKGAVFERAILLGPNATEESVRHEAAHAFLASPPIGTDMPLLRAQASRAVRDIATAEGWLAQIDERDAREERLAHAYALAFAPRLRL